MKKVVFIVLIALSLKADFATCQSYVKLSQKHSTLLSLAMDRKDAFDTRVQGKLTIMWLDRSIVECGEDWSARKTAEKLRNSLMKLLGIKSESI